MSQQFNEVQVSYLKQMKYTCIFASALYVIPFTLALIYPDLFAWSHLFIMLGFVGLVWLLYAVTFYKVRKGYFDSNDTEARNLILHAKNTGYGYKPKQSAPRVPPV